MPMSAGGLLRMALNQIPTILTLLVLGAIAWFGHANDWKLPNLYASSTAEEKNTEKIAKAGDTAAKNDSDSLDQRRIELASGQTAATVGIQVVPAKEQRVVDYVTCNAVIDYDPSTYAQLSVRAVGTVWWVEKHIGQPVRKGEVLALVEAVEVGKAKADFLQSLTQFDTRSKALQRMQTASSSVPDRSLLDAQAAVREARIRLFSDQQTLFNFHLPVRIEELQGLSEDQLVRRLRLLGVPPECLKDRGDPETLTANLLPLISPFDGWVVQRNASYGEAVTPARPLFVVADVRHLHIDLAVDPADAVRLRVGQVVTFESDREPQLQPGYMAKIAHISPEVDEKIRKVWAHAEVENPEGRLRPHAFGTGKIVIQERQHAVVVPADAVQLDEKTNFVFTRLNEKTFLSHIVRLGARAGTWVEVSGIQPGEEVVTTGSHVLKSELLKDRLGEPD